jgi:hypothetical protein
VTKHATVNLSNCSSGCWHGYYSTGASPESGTTDAVDALQESGDHYSAINDVDQSQSSSLLKLGGFGFGFEAGAVIQRIEVIVVRAVTADPSHVRDESVQLLRTVDSGVQAVGIDKKITNTYWPTLLTNADGGNCTAQPYAEDKDQNGELWGVQWTPDDVENIGLQLGVHNDGASTTAWVDEIRITVTACH